MMDSRDNISQRQDNLKKLVSTKYAPRVHGGRKGLRQQSEKIATNSFLSDSIKQSSEQTTDDDYTIPLSKKKTTQTVAKWTQNYSNHVRVSPQPSSSQHIGKKNHKINTLSPNQSYSSRNALRNFVEKEHKLPFKMPIIKPYQPRDSHYCDLERISNDIYNLKYESLSHTSFIDVSRNMALCYLCRRFIPHSHPLRAAQQHALDEMHVENYVRLENLLLKQDLEDSSLQMASVKELLDNWYEICSPSESESTMRIHLTENLLYIVKSIMPECELRIYGSFMTGTMMNTSNVNLELLHPNSRLFESDPRSKNSGHHMLIDPDAELGEQINYHTLHYDLVSNPMDTLYKLYNAIRNNYIPNCQFSVMSDLRYLSDKVPKLVLKHEPSDILFQMSCYAESSYLLADLLGRYLSLDTRLYKLCTIINYWAKECKINNPDAGTFPPDAFIIMAIYFLQRTSPPVLPCLHDLIAKDDKMKRGDQKMSNELSAKMKSLNLENDLSLFGQLNDNSSDLVDEDDGEQPVAQEDYNDDILDEDDEYDENLFDDNHEFKWTSENKDSIHKLFLNFLKCMMTAFNDINDVITIRTLRRISLRSKGWTTQFKALENPVRPRINISKCLGPKKTYHYIKCCFERTYYYLTSLPMDENLKPRIYNKSVTDPKDLCPEFFVSTERMDSYFRMRRESIISSSKNYDPILEMVKQKLFARDINVLEALIAHASKNGAFDTLPRSIANFYQPEYLFKNDDGSLYCRYCRSFGHDRDSCSKAKETEKCIEYDPSSFDNLDSCVNLDSALFALYVQDSISPRIAARHISLVKELESLINLETDLNCELILFGSTVNNLGSYDSDLDICLTLANNPTGKGVDFSEVLDKVHRVLSSRVDRRSIEMISSARVPIIKFKYHGFDVDISMYNQCAIYNSRLLKAYSELDSRVAQLFYLVKKYAKRIKIGDASRGSLSSYAWSLLTIHYLQHTEPKVLPVLQETGDDKIYGVHGWNVWFDDEYVWDPDVRNDWSLTQLFKGFFWYYANFDFDTYIVSIRKSALITRFRKSWYNSPIAIEDPFELTYNLAGRLEEPMAVFIRNSFARVLKHIISLQEEFLKDNHQRLVSGPVQIEINARMISQLFNGRAMVKGSAPKSSRGCKICERIGHKASSCPNRRENQIDRPRNMRRVEIKTPVR